VTRVTLTGAADLCRSPADGAGASLAISPYWLLYYFVMLLLERYSGTQAARTANEDR
jgi:hypothetical protein